MKAARIFVGLILISSAVATFAPMATACSPSTSFRFAQAEYTGSEAQHMRIVVVTVMREGPKGCNNQVDVNSRDVTATAGPDYEIVQAPLSFDAGDADRSFSVRIHDDGTSGENNEYFEIFLSFPTKGAQLGNPSVAKVYIDDDETNVRFRFAESYYTANEGSGQRQVVVQKIGRPPDRVTVDVVVGQGTATRGPDYEGPTPLIAGSTQVVCTDNRCQISWQPDDVNRTFQINVKEDVDLENDETINMVLMNPEAPGTLGTPALSEFWIFDNEPGSNRGILAISSATYSVDEGAGTVDVTLTRTGNLGGAVTATLTTSDGSANAGSDFTSFAEVINWAHGQSSNTTSIVITDDAADEVSETFNLLLSGPGGGAVIGAPASAVVTITDNDEPGATTAPASSTPATGTTSESKNTPGPALALLVLAIAVAAAGLRRRD